MRHIRHKARGGFPWICLAGTNIEHEGATGNALSRWAGLEADAQEFYIFVEVGLPMADSQISAFISDETKEMVERYVDEHGVKKGALVEQALLYYLRGLRELPADIVVPPRIKVTPATFAKVSEMIRKPAKPTPALRKLMAGKLDDDTLG